MAQKQVPVIEGGDDEAEMLFKLLSNGQVGWPGVGGLNLSSRRLIPKRKFLSLGRGSPHGHELLLWGNYHNKKIPVS